MKETVSMMTMGVVAEVMVSRDLAFNESRVETGHFTVCLGGGRYY